MSVVEIENELEKMTNQERFFVIEIAAKLICQETLGKPKLSLSEKRSKLRRSAKIMLSEYETNKELTAMTNLDGEDFIDA
jgi:hypothetical protein